MGIPSVPRKRAEVCREVARGHVLGALVLWFVLGLAACGRPPAEPSANPPVDQTFDVVLRGGTIYDGSGGEPFVGDLAVTAGRIVAVGEVSGPGRREIDVPGLAVAPGFINVLSWAVDSLILDPRSLSGIKQGVTLEVFGEGVSYGPLNEGMKAEMLARRPAEVDYPIAWTTLGEYLEHLVDRGVAPNVASFVGATTIRMHELGEANRPPSQDELGRMRALVAQAMEEGALGVGSSLIYAPAFYASTDELVALVAEAAQYGGLYISHLRSEGNRLVESVDELIEIARRAGAPAEIYHLKAAGQSNWSKLDAVIERVEAARAEGLRITADMYTYTAGATGLDAAMPPWVQEGGYSAWAARLSDPAIRAQVAREMRMRTDAWENLLLAARPEKALLVGFRNPDLRHLTGRSLADVAAERGVSPEEAAMDLVIEDGSRVGTVYFLMSEENVARQVAIPWVSFGSDAESLAPEGIFLESNPHPRAYGNFARLLGKYVREEGVITLAEAVRKLTSLPAENFHLRDRGRLSVGFHADIAVFDPNQIRDLATFERPHQLSTGMVHVFVNGEDVLRDGQHTGKTPGQVVRGPGWTGWSTAEDAAEESVHQP